MAQELEKYRAYTIALGQQIDFINEQPTDYFRANQNHILCGIIHITLYYTTLQKLGIPIPLINGIWEKVFSLFKKLQYTNNGFIYTQITHLNIINTFIDNLIEKNLFVEMITKNIQSSIMPIDVSEGSNLKQRNIGTILNATENDINIGLSKVSDYLDKLDKIFNLLKIQNSNNFEVFFLIIMGLLINYGNNLDIDPSIKKLIDGKINPAKTNSTSPAVREVQLDEEQYIKELALRIRCPICYTNECNVALNCGHMLCKICSESINTCPFCFKQIVTRLDLYYNKYLKYKTKYLALQNTYNSKLIKKH